MKTCAKCGKNVNDSTPLCPNCGSLAFHTDEGLDGGFSELLNMLFAKKPTLAWIILGIVGAVTIGGAIWFFTQVYSQVL